MVVATPFSTEFCRAVTRESVKAKMNKHCRVSDPETNSVDTPQNSVMMRGSPDEMSGELKGEVD
jgi:hypothetical protein